MVQPSPAIEALLPAISAWSVRGGVDPSELVGVEVDVAEPMGPNRRREFAAGRACARAAMQALGTEPVALGRRQGRIADWPDDLRGSITHSGDFAAAAASTDLSSTIGIDAEQVGRVTERLWRRVFTTDERERLLSMYESEASYLATVIFGVKEAFYKAQFVHTGAWVGFEDVTVTPAGDVLALAPATDLAVLQDLEWPVEGRWCDIVDDTVIDPDVPGLVVTATRVRSSSV